MAVSPDPNDIALRVTDLYKDFKLPHERRNSLKERIFHPLRKTSFDHLHALRDINFEVKRGEFFGIVGRNGSGKSTLLKIIGGIYQPTKGSLQVNGTLTPFIELGIGFNPELTGRENIFLNGAILGLTRKEIESKYQEIVDFAELEKFMDQKLKNYSSGMQVRLAFSIAIRAHNDILLIDEVLAVGDANFQRKCLTVFREIKNSGKTIIFVTHAMSIVQEFCDRAMMIQDSKIVAVGKPREIALRYEVANASADQGLTTSGEKLSRPKGDEVELLSVNTYHEEKPSTDFRRKQDIVVDVTFKVHKLKEAVQFNVFLVKPDGTYLAGLNTVKDLKEYTPEPGTHHLICRIDADQLVNGDYYVNTAVYTFVEPARLIDVLDVSYGVKVPRITVLEASKYQNGQFNMQGTWHER